jgi:hypothetical protein
VSYDRYNCSRNKNHECGGLDIYDNFLVVGNPSCCVLLLQNFLKEKMRPEEKKALAEIISSEIDAPQDIQKVYEDIGERFSQHQPLIEFLSKKDMQSRQMHYLKSEQTWFKLHQWTMAKALMLLAIISAGVVAIFPAVFTPDRFTMFIFGASAYFLLLNILSSLKFPKHKRMMHEVEQNYRQNLQEILKKI